MEQHLKAFLTDKAQANLEYLRANKPLEETLNSELVCSRVLSARDLAEQQELNPLLVVCPIALFCNWEQREPCLYHEEFVAENEVGSVDWPRLP